MQATEEEREMWQKILLAKKAVDLAVNDLTRVIMDFAAFKERQLVAEEELRRKSC